MSSSLGTGGLEGGAVFVVNGRLGWVAFLRDFCFADLAAGLAACTLGLGNWDEKGLLVALAAWEVPTTANAMQQTKSQHPQLRLKRPITTVRPERPGVAETESAATPPTAGSSQKVRDYGWKNGQCGEELGGRQAQ